MFVCVWLLLIFSVFFHTPFPLPPYDFYYSWGIQFFPWNLFLFDFSLQNLLPMFAIHAIILFPSLIFSSMFQSQVHAHIRFLFLKNLPVNFEIWCKSNAKVNYKYALFCYLTVKFIEENSELMSWKYFHSFAQLSLE